MKAELITVGDVREDDAGRPVRYGALIRFDSADDLRRFVEDANASDEGAHDALARFSVAVGGDLDWVADEIAEWQASTFPSSNIHGTVKHLFREALELLDEVFEYDSFDDDGNPRNLRPKPESDINLANVGEESTDIFFMLVQLRRFLRSSMHADAKAKLIKNRARRWKEPDEHGVVEHASECDEQVG